MKISGKYLIVSAEFVRQTLDLVSDLLTELDNRMNRYSEVRTKRILSLNDSPELLDHYHRILAEAGYASIVTSEEGEALTILRTEPIDLLIQDVQRPGMVDGFS